jgi:hypothetical protein
LEKDGFFWNEQILATNFVGGGRILTSWAHSFYQHIYPAMSWLHADLRFIPAYGGGGMFDPILIQGSRNARSVPWQS